MATFVSTKDIDIIIDPGAALGPWRYGLPPHEKEWDALEKLTKKIEKIAKKCDVIVITHYHYDHYEPDGKFYEGKSLFIKHPTLKINKSQGRRASAFLEMIEEGEYRAADGMKFEIGTTKIIFSEPQPHGPPRTRLGYVIMCCVQEDKEKFIFASDVQGPISSTATDFIASMKPDMLYIDGPPTYMLNYKLSMKHFQNARDNLKKLLTIKKMKIVMDHHLLRDLNYNKHYKEFESKKLITAAEFMGMENNMLEANRKILHGK